jgi:hypothetical protein
MPQKTSDEIIEKLRAEKAKGRSCFSIGLEYGLTARTVQRWTDDIYAPRGTRKPKSEVIRSMKGRINK